MRKNRKYRLYRKTRGALVTNKYLYQGNVITGYRIVMPEVRTMGISNAFVGKTKKRILTKPLGKRTQLRRRG